ncbi:hypothetical protein [Streptomyces spiramenti]|uniref:Uncharacterized protein n=1 Tax=Streptomyces spiramenti TaxID=2720606 RepID=A0ABX1AVD1_9ACTN|nr:hypothetical protein [Streptomyces spiramenti]NJP68778.1 hypothetical protein [Streptomyces spiramenti]
MPKRRISAQPGIAPEARFSAGTMFAALYGTLDPLALVDHEPKPDAHALFYQRSIAMGWLDDRSAGGGSEAGMNRASGLWSMNDAGWNHPLAAADTDLISWFQVEASRVADDRPLPVQPFLQCAASATARVGAIDLSAVQILLPLGGLVDAERPPYAPVPAMQTKDWFPAGHQSIATPAQVVIASGQGYAVTDIADQLADQVDSLSGGVFDRVTLELIESGALLLPPFGDQFWGGPALRGVRMQGHLCEWTTDSIGWLSEVVGDAGARLGIQCPVLITVTRA